MVEQPQHFSSCAAQYLLVFVLVIYGLTLGVEGVALGVRHPAVTVLTVQVNELAADKVFKGVSDISRGVGDKPFYACPPGAGELVEGLEDKLLGGGGARCGWLGAGGIGWFMAHGYVIPAVLFVLACRQWRKFT